MEIDEKDWKLLRKKLPKWQEDYMGKLVKQYSLLLNDDNKIASEKFWTLQKQIKKDVYNPGVVVRDLRRSNAILNVVSLLQNKVIELVDLEDFSQGFKETISRFDVS